MFPLDKSISTLFLKIFLTKAIFLPLGMFFSIAVIDFIISSLPNFDKSKLEIGPLHPCLLSNVSNPSIKALSAKD